MVGESCFSFRSRLTCSRLPCHAFVEERVAWVACYRLRPMGLTMPNDYLVLRRSLSHNNAVYGAAFSLDGKRLATASLDNTVKLWDVADGAHKATLQGHLDGVAFVGYLPAGTIATVGLDKTVRVWPADGGAAVLTLNGHLDYLTCGAVSRAGTRIASGGFDKTVRLWDGQTGAALATFSGHPAPVQAVAISPDGRLVAS